MNNRPPLTEDSGSPGWQNWFNQVFACLNGWRSSFRTSVIYAFGAIPAQSQASTTVAVNKARPGDSVLVTPAADTPGISYSGVVTANDTVTLYAKNFTAGAITPASTTFRIIVLQ
ncbi:hypothetical protein SAMN06265795_12652 [Noviherbaspirillum humi]|uniref:Uncharacterized protein n=1 Tax=Noviherbaspirillum humi TaxID=1688639 RepID=A0A239LV30_9BURK|nr:hypothetical protein [Noviherbaspirillum humi]SNT33822.1 hypothetical protein SAMN06265795_12652 [Noviherbaspirillum humi]